NSGRIGAGPPDRRSRLGVELFLLATANLTQVPVGVHQRQVGEGNVATDTQHLLCEPEREGVVVAGGDQDPVWLNRFENVDREVARQGLVVAGGGGVVAERRDEHQ